MKTLLLLLLAVGGFGFIHCQTCVGSISASGPTTFCQGGSVVLSANTTSDSWTQKADFGGIAQANNFTSNAVVELNINASKASLLIMDAKGLVVQRRDVNPKTFNKTYEVDLGNKASGVYVVKFVSETIVISTRVIVQ